MRDLFKDTCDLLWLKVGKERSRCKLDGVRTPQPHDHETSVLPLRCDHSPPFLACYAVKNFFRRCQLRPWATLTKAPFCCEPYFDLSSALADDELAQTVSPGSAAVEAVLQLRLILCLIKICKMVFWDSNCLCNTWPLTYFGNCRQRSIINFSLQRFNFGLPYLTICHCR